MASKSVALGDDGGYNMKEQVQVLEKGKKY